VIRHVTTPGILSCEHCGGKFEPARARGGRPIPTRYCSNSCRQRAFEERKVQRRIEEATAALRAEIVELRRRLGEV
jgi:hypothetical protein